MRRRRSSSVNFGYFRRRRRSKLKYIIVALLVVLLSGIAWYGLVNNGLKKSISIFGMSKHKVSKIDSKRNSLTKIKEKEDFSSLRKELEDYTNKLEGVWGIYFCNLEGGEDFGINSSQEFEGASIIKIPINLLLYKRVSEGKCKLEDFVEYSEEDMESGTGNIQYEDFGTTYSLRELSRLSLSENDNVAVNMIVRYLGGKKQYKDYMKKLGTKLVVMDKNITNPEDMGICLKVIYKFSLENKELGKEFIGYMEKTIFNKRLPKSLPKNVKIAHKEGNYEGGYFHDIGIIYKENQPYVLNVMTKGIKKSETADKKIAEISKRVYDYMERIKDEKNK